ncbi:MAG TPA: reverse transcriptase family protein [Planctomycetota bacterium]|nr:reverse transcriptase family protein [Planctomycetota bacterium]
MSKTPTILRAIFNFLGAIAFLLLLPIAIPFILIGLIIGGIVMLLQAVGLMKKPVPRTPGVLRADAWKPVKPYHRAWSTRPCKLRHHNRLVKQKPYVLARAVKPEGAYETFYFDGRVGGNDERLRGYGLPLLETPEDIAKWLNVPVRTLAWLGDYHRLNASEKVKKKQHYHYTWVKKRRANNYRLIEAPKPIMKTVQQRILREILDRVPAHPASHGFVKGRSIQSNAAAHVKKYALLKCDLENFYPKIRFKRVVALFGGMGYNIEASHWLARLCTNRIPDGLKQPGVFENFYQERHLPQGAPTSPAIANLCAYPLDVRLSGLAKKFGVTYTRYADDLTFSCDENFLRGKSMNWLIRYVRGIVRDERFTWNNKKKKIIRHGHRHVVTGLVVNEKPNIQRDQYDRLKAILHNCARKGPGTQNRDNHPNFRAHLQGRVAFVESVNPEKGRKLRQLFQAIRW